MIKLTDICTPKQWKTLSSSDLLKSGYPVYGANGIIGYWNVYNHKDPTVLITCRGATCGSVNLSKPFSYINGNAMCLDNVSDNYDVKFLFHYLSWYDFSNIITGSAQPQITRQSLSKVYIPLIDKKKQQDIVHDLTVIERALINRQQALSLLNHLVKSRFIEMFGDNMENPHAFPIESLEVHADIVSGITKGRKTKETNFIEVPYMAVSNVKDGYIDWTTVKTILATSSEIEQYRLQVNDVLMTEGGDPDKLGRGALLTRVPENCIHQNHIFRVRLDGRVNPVYFEEYLQTPRPKRYFLKAAKQTTGIASINMSQLRQMPLILPPVELQNQFADFVALTDKSKFAVQQSIDTLQTLKAKLMQDYFG